MAYTPSLADIPEISSPNSTGMNSYKPSLADIPAPNAPVSAQAAPHSSLLDSYYNYALNTTLGAGDAIQNTLADTANLIPGVNLPLAHTGSGFGYEVGRAAGNVGSFLAGGDALDAARGAAEELPVVGKVAQYLGQDGFAGVLRRALGSAAYGGITNPQDRAGGALEGAALSGGLDALPLVPKGIAKAAQYFNPNQKLQQILGQLGGGQSLEDNAKSIAQDVKSAYQSQLKIGKANYQPVFDQVGNTPLYQGANNELSSNVGNSSSGVGSLGLPASQINSQYNSLSDQIIPYFNNDLRDLHNDFIQNPTFQNAHELRSQLNSALGNLYKIKSTQGLPIADQNALSALQNGKIALTQDMNNFLLNQDGGGLANQYQNATSWWRENVAPYQENRNIMKMATGKMANPRSIATIFKNPEPAVQKISDDLPDTTKDKILYSVLGKNIPSNNPEAAAQAFARLNDQGLQSYVSPTVAEQFKQLNKTITNRNNLERVGGALGGLTLGHTLGLAPGTAELLGAGAGGLFGPQIIAKLGNLPFIRQAIPAISNAARQGYSSFANALRANLISGGNNGH